MYRSIDLVRTGVRIREQVKAAGYDVKSLQEYLQLSCPQPIYRWFKGRILPSVEHLCALSQLLGVHMEELLVLKNISVKLHWEAAVENPRTRFVRLYGYYVGYGAIGLSVQ